MKIDFRGLNYSKFPSLSGFFQGSGSLEISEVCIEKGYSCGLFGMFFHEGENVFKKL
jgi:hypothetical protein